MAQYYGYSAQPDKPNITVTGEAEIKVAPDNAVITLGIETLDSSMVDAKAENDRLVKSVTRAIKRLGVDESDIHTDYLNAEPKYEHWRDLGSFLGHNVKRRIVVTLKDVSKFDDLISDVIEAGVSRVLDIRFNIDDLRKYRDQARAMAIKAAADKARDMTAEIGQTVGKAIDIREGRSARRSWYRGWDWGRYYGSGKFNVSQNVASPESDKDGPLAIGKISVTASVSVSFLLE
jgi:uncharacterized protein YggE